jgi:hypothetical protein
MSEFVNPYAYGKQAAAASYLSQGGPPVGKARIFRTGRLRGMSMDQAMAEFERMWAGAPGAVKEKYARRRVTDLAPSELAAAREDGVQIPGDVAPDMSAADQQAARMRFYGHERQTDGVVRRIGTPVPKRVSMEPGKSPIVQGPPVPKEEIDGQVDSPADFEVLTNPDVQMVGDAAKVLPDGSSVENPAAVDFNSTPFSRMVGSAARGIAGLFKNPEVDPNRPLSSIEKSAGVVRPVAPAPVLPATPAPAPSAAPSGAQVGYNPGPSYQLGRGRVGGPSAPKGASSPIINNPPAVPQSQASPTAENQASPTPVEALSPLAPVYDFTPGEGKEMTGVVQGKPTYTRMEELYGRTPGVGTPAPGGMGPPAPAMDVGAIRADYQARMQPKTVARPSFVRGPVAGGYDEAAAVAKVNRSFADTPKMTNREFMGISVPEGETPVQSRVREAEAADKFFGGKPTVQTRVIGTRPATSKDMRRVSAKPSFRPA